MALRIIREVSRSLAFSKASGTTIIAGQPLMLASASSLQPYAGGSTSLNVYGLALEDTAILPIQGSNGETAGQGYDYTNFARGGNYSVLLDGGEVELFDDGRGAPFVASDLFQLNDYVYANSSGLITAVASSNSPALGVVTSVTGSPVTLLRIKLLV